MSNFYSRTISLKSFFANYYSKFPASRFTPKLNNFYFQSAYGILIVFKSRSWFWIRIRIWIMCYQTTITTQMLHVSAFSEIFLLLILNAKQNGLVITTSFVQSTQLLIQSTQLLIQSCVLLAIEVQFREILVDFLLVCSQLYI